MNFHCLLISDARYYTLCDIVRILVPYIVAKHFVLCTCVQSNRVHRSREYISSRRYSTIPESAFGPSPWPQQLPVLKIPLPLLTPCQLRWLPMTLLLASRLSLLLTLLLLFPACPHNAPPDTMWIPPQLTKVLLQPLFPIPILIILPTPGRLLLNSWTILGKGM